MTSLTGTYHSRTKRSYLTMNAFNDDMFTYTTTVDPNTFITTGALSAVSGATSGNCPKGRFLYENGKKLYPGANPNITTYMVGVFDPVSFLSGFIDPNSEAFTLMNTDKPVDMANSSNLFGTNPNGSTSDLAQPVFTRGDIIALGNSDICGNQYLGGSQYVSGSQYVVENIDVSGTETVYGNITCVSGNVIVSGIANTTNEGNLIVARQIRSSTVSTYASIGGSAVTILPRQGQVHRVTFDTSGTTISVSQADAIALPGAVVYIIVTNAIGATRNVDFNQYFTTNNAGIKAISSGATHTFSFVSGGDFFYEIGEIQAVSP